MQAETPPIVPAETPPAVPKRRSWKLIGCLSAIGLSRRTQVDTAKAQGEVEAESVREATRLTC